MKKMQSKVVDIVKEVKKSDGLWRLACGGVFFCNSLWHSGSFYCSFRTTTLQCILDFIEMHTGETSTGSILCSWWCGRPCVGGPVLKTLDSDRLLCTSAPRASISILPFCADVHIVQASLEWIKPWGSCKDSRIWDQVNSNMSISTCGKGTRNWAVKKSLWGST